MADNMTKNLKPQDWINLILAIALFISPWVVGFAPLTTPAWNAWIVAIVLAVFAVAALSAFALWEEWVNLVLGLWLVISPWALQFAAHTNIMWTNVVLGVLVAAVSAWAVWDHGQHVPA